MSKEKKCNRCETELVKADGHGMKCPNHFNCPKFDIVTDESIIEDLEKDNEALKEKLDDLARWVKYELSEAASEETKLVLNSIVKELGG